MPDSRDRAPLSRRRLLPLTVFIAAAVALLAFAGSAFAETKIGEGTSPEKPTLAGEADLLKATASYEVGTGTITFEITTREASESVPEAERPEVTYIGALVKAPTVCNRATIEAEGVKEAEEGKENSLLPFPEVLSSNLPVFPPEVPPAPAYGGFVINAEHAGLPESFIPGSKSLSGTTTTISATIPAAANGPFDCVEVGTEDFEGGAEPDVVVFPLTTKPEPPPVAPVDTQSTPVASTSSSTPAPAPAPAAISIAKAKKPLKLKVGKWSTVKVKVTNTGGTATAPGSLQLKTTKGVLVKAARQKLPALLPGGSWTVSYKVKLTAKAKKSSTLSLVGAAGSLAARGSLVLKALG
jgi:hypothetical protein